MDSPDIHPSRGRPKRKDTVSKIPDDIEKASIKSKIVKALGKYPKGFSKDFRESIADFMLQSKETLYLHPPTIAGAIALIKWSKSNFIEDFKGIFRDVTTDILINDRMVTATQFNQLRIKKVNEVLNNIIPQNLPPAELLKIKIKTKADIVRYMDFIESKVRTVILKLE